LHSRFYHFKGNKHGRLYHFKGNRQIYFLTLSLLPF